MRRDVEEEVCVWSSTSVCPEFGVTRTIDLKPNGSNVPVTRDNKLEYILRVSHYRLTKQIKEQSAAFFEGLSEMIDPKWLRYVYTPRDAVSIHMTNGCRMFNQQELQVLLGGVNTPIDLNDLRQNTNYGGLYDDKEPTIVAFWKVSQQAGEGCLTIFWLPFDDASLYRSWRASTLNNVKRCYALLQASEGLLFCGYYQNDSVTSKQFDLGFTAALVDLSRCSAFAMQEATKLGCRPRALA